MTCPLLPLTSSFAKTPKAVARGTLAPQGHAIVETRGVVPEAGLRCGEE